MKPYHMKRDERAIKEKSVIETIISSGKYMSIALIYRSSPYIVTMNYGYDCEREVFYFHCAREGLKVEAIKENPSACGTIIEDSGYRDGECDHAFRSLVLWGKIEFVETAEEKRQALKVMIDHLEETPEPVKARFVSEDKRYKSLTILRFTVEHITGKTSLPAPSDPGEQQ